MHIILSIVVIYGKDVSCICSLKKFENHRGTTVTSSERISNNTQFFTLSRILHFSHQHFVLFVFLSFLGCLDGDCTIVGSLALQDMLSDKVNFVATTLYTKA